MAIAALPQGTINLLGSGQALTTPLSLVKELVDNSLDAKATSIDIFISQNTLDKIEVRDNGHGIPEQDFESLGKRGHTSKLRSFEELKSVGGVSLGFRGEALASAVQMGIVSVTTKSDGEPIATTVTLKAPGVIANRARTSHPVGTTVCVKNFMVNLPVRRQTTLKGAPKSLLKIKELLQSYALARPSIRFSLKILKETKGSWLFSPRSNDGIKEAVSQVIGRDAAAHCIDKSFTFHREPLRNHFSAEGDATHVESELEQCSPGSRTDQFFVELFLPKPNADPTKVGHGQYLSIDSRPVSHEKGTMHKLVVMFKHYVKEQFSDTLEKISNPFLRLNIHCPVASYDPNVEPAKDDVLFENEKHILASIEEVFKNLYDAPNSRETAAQAKPLGVPLSEETNNFELLLSQKPKLPPQSDSGVASEMGTSPQTCHNIPTPNLASLQATARVIVGSSEQASPQLVNEGHREVPYTEATNRWGIDISKDLSESVERMNARNPNRRPQRNPPVTLASPRKTDNLEPNSNPWLPATNRAYTFIGSPPLLISPSVQIHSQLQNELETRPVLPRSNPRSLTEDPENDLLVGDDAIQYAHRNDFVSARNVPCFPISPPTTQLPTPKTSRGLQRPFVSPLITAGNRVSRDTFKQTTLFGDLSQSQPPFKYLQTLSVQPDSNSDLAWAMDFENRKEAATRQQRQNITAARRVAEREHQMQTDADDELPSRQTSRMKRHNTSIEPIEIEPPITNINTADVETVTTPFQTNLPNGDPRVFLMRHQRSMSLNPDGRTISSRTKSGRLPLERIPAEEQMYDLLLDLSITSNQIHHLATGMINCDDYIRQGKVSSDLREIGQEEIASLTSKIRSLISDCDESGAEKSHIEWSLENLLAVYE